MPEAKGAKRRFGVVRQYRSGRWTAGYLDPAGLRRHAAETFATQTDAEAMGPRWRLMAYSAACGSLRPEEQAELRRSDATPPNKSDKWDKSDELRRRWDVPQEPVLLRIVRASLTWGLAVERVTRIELAL